jgi:hypothetical protein
VCSRAYPLRAIRAREAGSAEAASQDRNEALEVDGRRLSSAIQIAEIVVVCGA